MDQHQKYSSAEPSRFKAQDLAVSGSESESLLQRAMAAGRIFSWEMDPATRELKWSGNMEAVIGFPLIVDVDKTTDMVHPDDRARLISAVRNAVERGEEFECEFRLVDPQTGDEPWFYSQGSMRQNAVDGRPLLTGITRNITRQKRAEAAASADLADTMLLRDLAVKLVSEENIQVLYDEITAAAIHLTRSDGGTVQIFDEVRQELVLLAWSGMPDKMVDHFRRVAISGNTSCSIALKKGERVFTDYDEAADDSDGSVAMHIEAGYRSAQSTPLVTRTGKLIGMVTTHWNEIGRRPTERELRYLDLLARQAADLIEQRHADEVLQKSEEKYRMLFDSLETGFCVIEVIFDNGKAVDYRIVESNPAFERQTGLKHVSGKRMRELAPDYEEHWFEVYGQIALSGVPRRFENGAQQLGRWYEVYAFRVGEPGEHRVAILFNDITKRKRTDEEVRRAASFNAFRVWLNDALRPLSSRAEIQETASRLLRELLDAAGVHYGEITSDDEFIVFENDFSSTDAGRPVQRFRMEDFGSSFVPRLRAGEVIRVADAPNDPNLSEAERAANLEAGIISQVAVPLIKNGRLSAVMLVHDTKHREWSPDEVALVEETAERVWAAVERAQAEKALIASHARTTEILESISDAFFAVDEEFRFTYVNKKAEELWKRERESLIGKHFWTEFPIAVGSEAYQMHHRVMADRQAVHFETISPIIKRWIDVSIYPDERGGLSCYFRDITARKRAEEALRESEVQSRLLIEGATDFAIMRVATDGLIASWNTGAERMFGYSDKDAIGQPTDILFTAEDRVKGIPQKELEAARTEGRAEDERWHVRQDGTRFFASGVMMRLGEGSKGFVKIARDRTDKLTAEKAERDREILQRMVGAQEDERKRLARDLHDELGQQLTALRLMLEQIRNSCDGNDEVTAQIDEVRDLAHSIDDGVDFLAWELRPSVLDDIGLFAALDKYVKEWSQRSGINSEFITTNHSGTRFPHDTETNLYRILQEALNNVHKHARATNVGVVLDTRHDSVILVIDDDGVGFDPENKKNRNEGMGLTGMQERASLVGGKLEIESAPEKGTTIFVSVPIVHD